MQRRRGSCMNDFSQPQCAKPALNVAQDGVGGCFLADRGSKRRCRSLAILAALLSFGGCLRGDAVIDFRNFIEGVLDAPVYDVDGVTKLQGNQFFVELFANWMPVGIAAPFQTSANAGYWIPQEVTLPGAMAGQQIWVLVRVYGTLLGF